MGETYLEMQMWLFQDKLKGKTANLRLSSTS